MTKVEEFYNTLIKDPDLEVKAGQTREQAAKQEAEYRARQYNNNVQALSLANEPAQVESPINALFNHLEQMKKSMPDTALIKAREDFETPADEEGAGPNKAEQRMNERATQYHNDIKNNQEQRKLKGESYKREVQRYESGRKLDAERANQRFQSIHENAVNDYNDRLRSFENAYTIRQARAEDLERPIKSAENLKTARKQAIENYRNIRNDINKRNSASIKQDRKKENESRTRQSDNFKEEFKKVEQRNLERAKTLQDSFAGETKADRIDAYRQALKEGPSYTSALPANLTPIRPEEISFDEAQRRMYPQEGQAFPTKEEQHSLVRASIPNGPNLSDAEVKNILNPKPLTNQEVYERAVRNPAYQNITSIEEAKTAIEAKPITDEQVIQGIIDNTGEFNNIKTVEDAKAAMNPKPFTKKEKYDMVREQLKKNEGGFFSRFKNKKITDADVTAALNPKRLTTEEKIERLMTGKDSGGVVKLSREEALEALKKPKQLTNKEKLQNLIDSDSPQHSNIKTEDDAKNYLNPKPLTEQQQHEYIANRFSLSGPDEAAKAFNNTPFTDEEKIQFVKDRVSGPAQQSVISTEEAENILNPKNKHFEPPTFADDTPAETEPTAEEPAAEQPTTEAETPTEEPAAEVDTPTEESTPEETPTQETPAAEEPTGIGAINQGAAEVLQRYNDEISDNNKKIESNQNKISEIDSRVEELRSKQDSEDGLSEKEFQELQGLPDEKRTLERNISNFEEEVRSATGMQDGIVANMKRNHQLTDDDVSKLRESSDISALIDEGTQPETTQEETTPEPEQPEVTPEQSTDTPPAASRINPRTAAAAKEHLGEERYNELLENGDLEGKNIADIREEFPKPDAEEPETATAEEEPKTETEEPAAEPEQPEAEAPQAETPEPEPQASTPEMDNLIDTAKQNRKDEKTGEEIEGSSLFDHLYEKTHGKDNPYGDKEEFERELRAQDPSKLKTKLRDEHLKRQQVDQKNEAAVKRDAEQKEIKEQANRKTEANALPHDANSFKGVSKDNATHMAAELIAHYEKHGDNLTPATRTKLEKILAAGKEAGADYDKITSELEKHGKDFGSEKHMNDFKDSLANDAAEAKRTNERFREVRSNKPEAQKNRRRSGMEAAERAKDFHHGEDLGTKSSMEDHDDADHFDHPKHKKTSGSLDTSNMPPAMRENAEEMQKEKPNKELIAKNKAFLAQKQSEGYKWHPETQHWVQEKGFSSLMASHKGNSGTILGGEHQVGDHPPTLLQGDGSSSGRQVLYANKGLHNIGGDSLHGQSLKHSLGQTTLGQHALDNANTKDGFKLNNVSAHTNHAGLTTQETLKPTLTTAAQAGKQKLGGAVRGTLGSAVSRLKTSFTDNFLGKSEYPQNYPSALELLVKTYNHESRLDARELLEETSKTKKSKKKTSIIKVS